MPVVINISTKGAKPLADYLARVKVELMPAVERATALVADAVTEAARANIDPKYPDQSTGELARSILPVGPHTTGTSVEYIVGSSLVYSRIQELGGTITANGNAGGDGRYLVFKTHDGAWHKVNSVTIPAKHYMAKGAADGALGAEAIVVAAIAEVLA